MSTPSLDSRLHAYDPEQRLAEEALRPQLGPDWTYHQPSPKRARQRLSLKKKPQAEAAQVSEALPGEALELLWTDSLKNWGLVRTLHDRYLGWTLLAGLGEERPDGEQITALRAHAYREPRVSSQLALELCLGAQIWPTGAPAEVNAQGHRWRPVHNTDGVMWVQEVCFEPSSEQRATALAQRFLDTPYVWGGRSAWGLDCSGLTQLVFGALGYPLPRDADQQQAALTAVEQPQAGDLAFFPGHVGLMLDERRLLHANATHMRVTIDTLGQGDYGLKLQQTCTGYGRVALSQRVL